VPAGASGSERDTPKGTAKDRALRLLGVRWRSREELRDRLARAGFQDEEIEHTLVDLERVGLVDDERFARELVKDQATRRSAGDRAIRAALRQRGVDQDTADRALEGTMDEEARAFELADRQANRLRGVPIEAAHRRILGQLMRRGYPPAMAREATRRALAERSDADPPDSDVP
jgi:regulatory protein